MKKLITAALIFAACFSSQGVSRVINETWNIARTPLSPMNVWFLQAESIKFNLTCMLGEEAYPLTNENTTVIWEISQGENYTNLMAIGTGTVVSATGGVVRLSLTPEQSNLTNGTYNGYVIARDTAGGITNRLVLARQNIIIGWSPYGLEYAYVGVSSPFYTIGAVDDLLAPLYASTSTWDTVILKASQADFASFTNAQYLWNTNVTAQITNVTSQITNLFSLFESYTNTQAEWNTNLFSLFESYTNTQSGLNTNLSTWLAALSNIIAQSPWLTNVVDYTSAGIYQATGDVRIVYNANTATNYMVASGFVATVNGVYTRTSSSLYTNSETGVICSNNGAHWYFALNTNGYYSNLDEPTPEFPWSGTGTNWWVPGSLNSYGGRVTAGVATNTQISLTNLASLVTSLEGRTNTWNEVTNKVGRTDFNSVSNDVLSLKGRTNTWNAVTNKVSQTDFTSVSGRVVVLEGLTTNHSVVYYSAVPSTNFVIAEGFGSNDFNGVYTLLTSTLWTNEATGAKLVDNGSNWTLLRNGSNRYRFDTTNSQPWVATNNAWYAINGGIEPAGTVKQEAVQGYTNTLEMSWQWVSAPTGSTASGAARQASYPSDTNQYFYWFQPAAVSGDTTGIWLRVSGSTF